MRTYADFLKWFWGEEAGSVLPLRFRLLAFREAYRRWLARPERLTGAPLPNSVGSLVDWFIVRFGPLPPANEPALRERYWRLWDRAVTLHIRRRRGQARDGALILRRLGFGARRPHSTWR